MATTVSSNGDRALHSRRMAGVERLVWWLDSAFRIPGTRWRIGLDGLIGLIPGIGDAVSAAMGAVVIAYAAVIGVRGTVIARMIRNLVIDTIVGAVPLLGDIFDVFWKSNRRNLDLLRRELGAGG